VGIVWIFICDVDLDRGPIGDGTQQDRFGSTVI
jgi:hypothetical protein